eukprot:1463696-Prymnesium_polylepis.4
MARPMPRVPPTTSAALPLTDSASVSSDSSAVRPTLVSAGHSVSGRVARNNERVGANTTIAPAGDIFSG